MSKYLHICTKSCNFAQNFEHYRFNRFMKRPLLPKHERLLNELGENIRLARLRRDLSSEQIAERAGIARNTLIKIERGDEGVAMGMYLRVLIALGLQDDLLLVAKDDTLGRKLQDAKLTTPQRATKRPTL